MMTQTEHRRGPAGRIALILSVVLLSALGVGACDFLDPTDVQNPRTTPEDLAQSDQPTAALVPGLRAQFARLVGSTVVVAECVSDNFSIHGTGLLKEWDTPTEITPSVNNSTGEATGLYWNAQELRALGDFILNEIVPNDETATGEQIAQAHYYRGMAYLYLAENFSYVPLEEDGAPVPTTQHLSLAVQDLTAALGGGDLLGVAAQAALARAYRWQGDATQAAGAANAVLSADDEFLFAQFYDAQSVENNPFFFLVSRALQEMQPLPRLDFLDPKFLERTSGIPVAKAEEMHLILAEIALAQNQYGNAKQHLANAIELANSRATTSFFDEDPRNNADLSIRPRDSVIQIRADAQSPYRGGLVLDRPGATDQRVFSGSSLNPDSVLALPAGDPDAIWHAFHLARQEILFLEGRRMADLGIKLPMMLREVDANPNIDDGDPGTVSVVPAYIPAFDGMDLFTPASPYDGELLVETQVTITYDMNKILTTNRVSPFLN